MLDLLQPAAEAWPQHYLCWVPQQRALRQLQAPRRDSPEHWVDDLNAAWHDCQTSRDTAVHRAHRRPHRTGI